MLSSTSISEGIVVDTSADVNVPSCISIGTEMALISHRFPPNDLLFDHILLWTHQLINNFREKEEKFVVRVFFPCISIVDHCIMLPTQNHLQRSRGNFGIAWWFFARKIARRRNIRRNPSYST